MAVAVITVTRGTAVTVFVSFTKPTRATYPTVKMVAGDPSTVELRWHYTSGAVTTWTYGSGTQIAKLSTGVYVATIPTKTGNSVRGTVTGSGGLTATGQFSIGIDRTTP